jgi:hypothetical protein
MAKTSNRNTCAPAAIVSSKSASPVTCQCQAPRINSGSVFAPYSPAGGYGGKSDEVQAVSSGLLCIVQGGMDHTSRCPVIRNRDGALRLFTVEGVPAGNLRVVRDNPNKF